MKINKKQLKKSEIRSLKGGLWDLEESPTPGTWRPQDSPLVPHIKENSK